MENKESVIKLLKFQREGYSRQQKFHYFTFAALILILLLDFIIIVYTKAVALDGYAWAGIIFLFVLISIEAKQYLIFKELKENVDEFYLRGEYAKEDKR